MHIHMILVQYFSAAFLTNICVSGQVDFSYNYKPREKVFEIEISCLKPPTNDVYCSIAFAREQLMEKAEGYYCNGRELQPFAIQIHQEPPIEIEDPNIQVLSVTQGDSSISCKFTRPVKVKREIDFETTYDFDFQKETFFILEAQGSTTDGKMEYHDYRRSSEFKRNFSIAIDVVTEDEIENPRDPNIGCEDVKTCFRYPDMCDLSSPSCMFISYRQDDTEFEFEIRGGYGHGLEYMALAFSTDTAMTDADLYYCTGTELKVGIIREHGVAPITLPHNNIVNVTSADSYNAVGHCKFRRPACVRHIVSDNKTMEFDFLKNPYYILMAKGEIHDGKIVYHDTNRVHTAIALQLGNETRGRSEYQCVTSGQDFRLRATNFQLVIAAFSAVANILTFHLVKG